MMWRRGNDRIVTWRGRVSILRGARIVLGITGGVAAYKAVDLASKFVQQGAQVDAVLTDAAREFIGPASLNAITRRPVHSSVFEPWTAGWVGHLSLGEESDLIVVAPADRECHRQSRPWPGAGHAPFGRTRFDGSLVGRASDGRHDAPSPGYATESRHASATRSLFCRSGKWPTGFR